ncbi:MAG: peptidoglycan-binding domain-containing protein, partial [Patescibacteria group bacterium]
MRKLLLSFGLAALLLPVLATAQDTGTAAPLYCPNLSITMQKCAPTRPLSQQRCTDATTEGQVTELQKFLSDYYDLNPADYVSGYFGRLTRDNVRRFQCEKMSICSGDEASTGYGVVGRKTRAAIANACGTETTPPPNNPPPTSPTCTMKATPYTISPGQSSLLSWTSTNANSGTITTLGAVPLYGSQTIFPTQNTTYTGTFWGHQSVATCNASVNVQGQTCQRPNPPAGCHWQSADTCVQDQLICGTTNSCQLDGVEVLNGGIRKFYLYRNQSSSSMCQTYSIDRTCTNGTLSG